MGCRAVTSLALLPMLSVVCLVTAAAPTNAQSWCQDWVRTTNNTSDDCTTTPSNDRFFALAGFEWNGTPHYVLNRGNELEIYDIDGSNASQPDAVATSSFNVPHAGDNDYDLLSFSVCDECEYGSANFRGGLMVFKIISHSGQPLFNIDRRWPEANTTYGSFVFEHSGSVYLLANGISGTCSDGSAGLFRISDSGSTINLQQLSCIDGPGGAPVQVLGGVSIFAGTTQYLWLGDSSNRIQIYRVDSGPSLTRVGPSQQIRANLGLGRGLDVDHEAQIAVAAYTTTGVHLFDVSDPSSPTELWSYTGDTVNRVAVRSPLLWTGQQGSVYHSHSWDISNPSSPVELDTDDGGFWHPDNDWNDYPCQYDHDAVFHPDGDYLYIARYSVTQVFDVSGCGAATAPTAGVSVSPPDGQDDIFPGDTARIVNASQGTVHRSAIWVTDSSDPDGTVVVGSRQLRDSTPLFRNLPIPVDLAVGVGYWAHVAVENDTFPYDPGGSTPGQIATRPVTVDRAPTAAVSYSQPPVYEVEVDLVADVEGTPGSPQGADPYTWTLTPPGGGKPQVLTSADAGRPFTFDQIGDWTVDLRVEYRHAAVTGEPYVATAETDQIPVRSVAPAFEFQPADPIHNQALTLHNLSSASPTAELTLDWDVLNASTGALELELADCDGPGTVDDDCTIPADTLDPDTTYTFRLTLTNTDPEPDDVDAVTHNQFIADGTVLLDFNVSDTSPDIGQTVIFSVDGLSQITSAQWSFGGSHCDGLPETFNCTAGVVDCLNAAYRYTSSGPKTISLRVVKDGSTYGPVSRQVTVSSAGSCGGGGGGGGGSCSYAISSSSAAADGSGDSGSFDLSTSSGCTWWAVSQNPSWLVVTAPSGGDGDGPGSISWAASANGAASDRSGTITVGGRTFTVLQGPACSATAPEVAIHMVPSSAQQGQVVSFSSGPPGQWTPLTGGDGPAVADLRWQPQPPAGGELEGLATTVPGQGSGDGGTGRSGDDDSWSWTVSMLGEVVARSDQPSFQHRFSRPGVYDVAVSVQNCAGFDSDTADLVVQPLPEISLDAAAGYSQHAVPRCLLAYGGGLLVGTEGSTTGGGLFRMSPGGTWSTVTTTGLDDPDNTAVSSLAAFGGFAYAGTQNEAAGAQVWRSTDGVVWTPVIGNGFGDPLNAEIVALEVHGRSLFAATRSVSGAEIWRTANGSHWSQVNLDGFGSAANGVPGALASFGSTLYATVADPSNAEVWRWLGGTAWEQVNADGFGDSFNQAAPSMATHDGELYVGTRNPDSGTEIWRTADGTAWSRSGADGFGSPSDNAATTTLVSSGGMLYAGTSNFSTGGEVWATRDGATWYPWVPGGFGDQYNWSVTTAAVVGDALFTASENPFGFQVWRMDLPGVLVFSDGFESGDAASWSATQTD